MTMMMGVLLMILAEGSTAGGVVVGGAGVTVLTVIGLLIKRGFSVRVGNTDGNGKNAEKAPGKAYVEKSACDLRHTAADKLHDERKERTDQDVAELKASVHDLDTKMDEGFKHVYRKLDRIVGHLMGDSEEGQDG